MTRMPEGLVAFLNARYDEIERAARAAIQENQTGQWDMRDHESEYWMVTDSGSGNNPIVSDKGWPSDGQAIHIALHDPASVLLDVEAKRRLLALHRPVRGVDPFGRTLSEYIDYCDVCSHASEDEMAVTDQREGDGWPCGTLRIMALPYASHPAYLPEWAPHE